MFLRITNVKRFWGYFFPINIILSFSAMYEIYEWVSVSYLPSEISYLFVGGNDPWDAVKDMSLAAVGAVITTVILAVKNRQVNKSM